MATKKLSKVFVVTSGSYSDYGINAMFSTRKLAQAYIDKAVALKRDDGETYSVGNVSWADDANIEEWDVDAEAQAKNHTHWRVGMILEDGSVSHPMYSRNEFGVPHKGKIDISKSVPAYGHRDIAWAESCRSPEHAMKLAVEARQAWLRKGGN